jgi:hypothetical protein
MTSVPEPVARVAAVMSTFAAPWSLCGGWAVDAWLGRLTRDHGDVDISVFQDDQHALFDHLAGWQLIGHDPNVPGNTSEPWDGVRRLELPAHIHGRSPDARREFPDRLDDPAAAGFGLDIQLDDRSGDDWIMKRRPRISRRLAGCVQESPWGLPATVAEVLLFFKAAEPRRRDERDFLALLPHLNEEQRTWLSGSLSVGHPDHHWVPALSVLYPSPR